MNISFKTVDNTVGNVYKGQVMMLYRDDLID